jgi:hypothetical protein
MSTTACDSWASRPPSPAATTSSCGRYATNASVAAPPPPPLPLPPALDADEEAADDRSAAVRERRLGRQIWGRSAAAVMAAAAASGRGSCGGCDGGGWRVWTGGRAARRTWLDRGRWRRIRVWGLWFRDYEDLGRKSVGFFLQLSWGVFPEFWELIRITLSLGWAVLTRDC